MVETSLGFSDSGEVSVFSGDDFWGLLDWERSAMGMSVGWDSPVRVNWCGVVSDDWSGVVWSNNMNWSLWQVGGGNNLESVVSVSNIFDCLNVSVSVNIAVSTMGCSVMRFGFVFGAQRIAMERLHNVLVIRTKCKGFKRDSPVSI